MNHRSMKMFNSFSFRQFWGIFCVSLLAYFLIVFGAFAKENSIYSIANSETSSSEGSPRIPAYRPENRVFRDPRQTSIPGLNEQGLLERRNGSFRNSPKPNPLLDTLSQSNLLPKSIIKTTDKFGNNAEFFYSPRIILLTAQKPANENPPTENEVFTALTWVALVSLIIHYQQKDQATNGFNQSVRKARSPKSEFNNFPAQLCNQCANGLRNSARFGGIPVRYQPVRYRTVRALVAERRRLSDRGWPIVLTFENYDSLVETVANEDSNLEVIFNVNLAAFHFVSLFSTILLFSVGFFFTLAYFTGAGTFFSSNSLLGFCVLFSSLLVLFVATACPFSGNLIISTILFFFSQLFSALTLFFSNLPLMLAFLALIIYGGSVSADLANLPTLIITLVTGALGNLITGGLIAFFISILVRSGVAPFARWLYRRFNRDQEPLFKKKKRTLQKKVYVNPAIYKLPKNLRSKNGNTTKFSENLSIIPYGIFGETFGCVVLKSMDRAFRKASTVLEGMPR